MTKPRYLQWVGDQLVSFSSEAYIDKSKVYFPVIDLADYEKAVADVAMLKEALEESKELLNILNLICYNAVDPEDFGKISRRTLEALKKLNDSEGGR